MTNQGFFFFNIMNSREEQNKEKIFLDRIYRAKKDENFKGQTP